jgi:hypothetical protein
VPFAPAPAPALPPVPEAVLMPMLPAVVAVAAAAWVLKGRPLVLLRAHLLPPSLALLLGVPAKPGSSGRH